MTKEEMKTVLWDCEKTIDNSADRVGAAFEIIECIEKLEHFENLQTITISMEEYKELIMVKGRYEELKAAYTTPQPIYPAWGTKITYRSDSEFKEGEKE